MEWQLAQVNVGRLRAPMDDPMIAEFKGALDLINALADGTPGFVWRLQTEEGNATDIQPVEDDELVIVNMSVWESVEALGDYVYRSDHTGFMRRRREWFERYGTAYLALWWVPAGRIPSVEEAFARLDVVERDGPTPHAFTFRHPFPSPNAADSESFHADERDACPAGSGCREVPGAGTDHNQIRPWDGRQPVCGTRRRGGRGRRCRCWGGGACSSPELRSGGCARG